ncbi:DNA-directed RNA polymerase II subunit RPB1 [Plutella xylostella]|uniref:DNA-directed RNA polymerase II subunit RPB1 n=1 Tax=Plutella xylostella TaxID=51655 RepID=UPI002032BDC3|nr:DNA-directed RNA polymerase II subunit RPB1 [Plutella xylostella]
MFTQDLLLLMLCSCCLAALDGYSARQDPDQFHIQTDEDDDRYFLYQTHNGQYRKERRLKDGSVVGTTGWVGADGMLRLQDYIADDQGYRVYKSKTVYVGVNRPIGESIKIAKSAPADPGYGVTHAPVQRNRGQARFSPSGRITPTTYTPPSVTYAPPSPTYGPPRRYPAEVSITPPTPYHSSTARPHVEVSPNSIDNSSPFNFKPTVSPITADEASPSPNSLDFDPSNKNSIEDHYYGSDSTPYKRLDIYNPNSYRHSDDWLRRHRPSNIGDGYTPQYPNYDGIAFRRNGFRYYLPKQYHEEVSGEQDERTGSFGYVDPFGIRRVIYYNSSPDEGFKVRKNNRYVGHDATPYDPRPIN